MITLVIGATKSGKSEWAELLAERSGLPVIYIATAVRIDSDQEWQHRLQQHRDRRPSNWQTLEVSVDLASNLSALPARSYALVDALGTWLANVLDQDQETWQHTERDLITAVQKCPADLTIVAEEVGWGVVPAYASGRQFRDRLGSLSRKLGAIADVVYLVTGGHALNLTLLGEKLPSTLI